MKSLAFLGLAALFLLCRICLLKPKKIVLLRRFPQWGTLGALGDRMAQDPRLQSHQIVRIEQWRRLSTVYHLATAGFIFLNDGFRPLARFPVSKRTKIIQLWHADGALKRWGHSVGDAFPEAKRWTCAICSGEAMRAAWAEAFGIPLERVWALGSPQLDALVQPRDVAALRAAFDEQYPQCKGKHLVLYAPSFRDDDPDSASLLAQFNFEQFRQRFDDIALLVRLHPKLHGRYTLPPWVVDLTGQPGLGDFMRISDRLITDYASLMTEAAALGLPMVLYAYDYDEYMAHERGFYVDLRTVPPGPIVTQFDELLELLAKPDDSADLRANFVKHHIGTVDGNSGARIIERVILAEEGKA